MIPLTIINESEYHYILNLVEYMMVKTNDDPENPINDIITKLADEIKTWEDRIYPVKS